VEILDLNRLPQLSFNKFEMKCKKVLNNKEFEKLRKKIVLYRRGTVLPEELFDHFCYFFGNVDVIHFLISSGFFLFRLFHQNSQQAESGRSFRR
jgi:hypothetical protein